MKRRGFLGACSGARKRWQVHLEGGPVEDGTVIEVESEIAHIKVHLDAATRTILSVQTSMHVSASEINAVPPVRWVEPINPVKPVTKIVALYHRTSPTEAKCYGDIPVWEVELEGGPEDSKIAWVPGGETEDVYLLENTTEPVAAIFGQPIYGQQLVCYRRVTPTLARYE